MQGEFIKTPFYLPYFWISLICFGKIFKKQLLKASYYHKLTKTTPKTARGKVLKRIKNQFNYENFDKTKHTVISNDGVLENLKRKVKEVLIEIEKNL